MKKRMVCLLLGLVLTISQVVTVLATTEDELRQQTERDSGGNQLYGCGNGGSDDSD